MMSLFMLSVALVLCGQEQNQDLSVKILSTDSDARVILEIEYPQGQGGSINIRLFDNGKEVGFQPAGGGFGGGYEQKDISFIPTTFGKHTVKIIKQVGDKTTQASIEFDYHPRPLLQPLWEDNELFLQLRSLTVKTRYIDSLRILVNGKTASYKFQKDMPDDFSRTAVVVEPELQSGLNLVEISAIGYDGKAFYVNTSCYYAKDAVVKRGDSFNLVYGEVGTKSGPFYRVQITGVAIKETTDAIIDNVKLVKTLKAVTRGRVTITIFKKPHFLESEELERSFTLTVR
jgi:hypothetical protein